MNRINKIYKDIKTIHIQGATSIAKAAIKAYSLSPKLETKRKLASLRPTEPMLFHVLDLLGTVPEEEILSHFSSSQDKINRLVFKIIPQRGLVFTHCHSTNVINALVYSWKKGKKFSVFNTETRPLFQGRKTSKELSKAGIPVTNVVDSAAHESIIKADLVLLGADAILPSGVINKIGSAGIGDICFVHKKPLYIVADSWKFFPKRIKIEERKFNEVWSHAPRKIKVLNPSFDFISKKYIKGIISEKGIKKFDQFVKLN